MATVGVALGPLFQLLPFQVKVGPILTAHFSVGSFFTIYFAAQLMLRPLGDGRAIP